ncbi:hypothetical protein EC991_006728 [Linnemannia zychae]|nr:hypothetical protein EC991_006728 [Linnemannia zychae]
MAPKQKVADNGSSSNSKSSSAHGNSHSTSEGRHASGASSERGGSTTHDRSFSNINNTSTHTSSNSAGSSALANGGGAGGSHNEKGGSSSHAGGSGTTGSGTKRKAESPLITMDFDALDVSALRRYCRLNHLKPKSKTREALVAAATAHWNNTNAQEVDSVAYFLFAVKHRHNVLKLTMPLS